MAQYGGAPPARAEQTPPHTGRAGPAATPRARRGIAQYGDAPRERSEQSQHQPDGRGLAAAVGAEEAVNGPLRDMQVQILDLERPAGAIAQSLDLDGVGHDVPTPISSAIAACSSGSDTPRCPARVSISRT